MPHDADPPKPSRASARDRRSSDKGRQFNDEKKEAAVKKKQQQEKPAATKATKTVVAKGSNITNNAESPIATADITDIANQLATAAITDGNVSQSKRKRPPEQILALPPLPEHTSLPSHSKKAKAAPKKRSKTNNNNNNNNNNSRRRRQSALVHSGPYIATGPIKSPLPSSLDKSLPDAMKACATGWKPQSLGKRKYEVYDEREYDEKYMGGLLDSYIFVAESTERHLRELGMDNNPANTVANLISDEVFAYIAHHTTQQLVKRNLPPVDVYEFKRFYATKLLRSRFKVSSDQAWKEVMEPLATRHGFSLMDMNRFNNILTHKMQSTC